MANTLHEMAVKLQESIIRQQEDSHNSGSLNVAKYNNLKLSMQQEIRYPHIVVRIGISEAIYNLNDGSRTDGSLGPDERYVRRWLASNIVLNDLVDIYKTLEEGAKEDAGDEDFTTGKKLKKFKRTELVGMGNINANFIRREPARMDVRRDVRAYFSGRTRRYIPTEPPEPET